MIVTGNQLKGFTVITRKELNTDFNAITELNGYIYIATKDGFYTMCGQGNSLYRPSLGM